MKKIRVLIKKEWSEIFRNKMVIYVVAFLPLLFTLIPLVALYFTNRSGDIGEATLSDVPPQFLVLCQDLTGSDCMNYYLVSQFVILFILLPMIIPMNLAAYSIVGEKTTRTLEPLLATPITTGQLLVGKAGAAILPGLGATWLAYLLFIVGALVLGTSFNVIRLFISGYWLTAIVLLSPLLALTAVSISIMVSSRVTDVRAAEQISGLFVLPLVGLFIGQATGLFLVDTTLILWMTGALLVIDTILMVLAIRLFQRENILTKWK